MNTFDLLKAGGAVGALIGLIPLLYSVFHARATQGVIGLLACAVGGVAGLIVGEGMSVVLALLIAGAVTWWMFRADQVRP